MSELVKLVLFPLFKLYSPNKNNKSIVIMHRARFCILHLYGAPWLGLC